MVRLRTRPPYRIPKSGPSPLLPEQRYFFRQFNRVPNLHFVVNTPFLGTDRIFFQVQDCGDLLCPFALGHQLHHAPLAGRMGNDRVAARGAAAYICKTRKKYLLNVVTHIAPMVENRLYGSF